MRGMKHKCQSQLPETPNDIAAAYKNNAIRIIFIQRVHIHIDNTFVPMSSSRRAVNMPKVRAPSLVCYDMLGQPAEPSPAEPSPAEPSPSESSPSEPQPDNLRTELNIVIFGETSSGKSSIVNLIGGHSFAPISSGAGGCTFSSERYPVDIMGTLFNVYDTAGLNEGEEGRIANQDAIAQLYKLMCSLSNGVSLLVFCVRAPRIRDNAHNNWRLFYEVICQKKVPIVIAVTGLENEDPMDDWWMRNKGEFQQREMFPSGFACITATKGKHRKGVEYTLGPEYEASKEKMRNLIKVHCLERPWKVKRIEWFTYVVDISYTTEWCFRTREIRETRREAGEGMRKLVERCRMSETDAEALAEILEDQVEHPVQLE